MNQVINKSTSNLYIVVPDPAKGIVELRINGLQVLHGEFFVEHPLVEWHREARVDEFPMVQSL